jgi:crotonobetainyl-CoA:carnitine CoA-transferase CaiB-like acyl-CoA transferase
MMAGASWVTYAPQFCDITGHREILDNEDYMSPIAGLVYGEELAKFVGDILITKDREEWVKLFTEADFPHEIIQHIPEIFEDEQAWVNNYLFKHQYKTGNTGVFSHVPIFFENQPQTEFVHSGAIGADTEAVLKNLGYTAEQIDALASSGAIVK